MKTKEALTELGVRYGLNDRQLGQLGALLHELEGGGWAPTAVRDAVRAADVHLADALVASTLPVLRSACSLADLGAGAGFPGLPLAVVLPQAEVRLVESQARKCAFIERMGATASIENARVVCARAEEWHEGLGGHDVVLARALAPQPVVLEYAAPLLRVGGTLVDWRGRRDAEEEARAVCAAAQLGLRLLEIRHTEPYAGARDHHLHLFEKLTATPSRFPRRAGVARRRPLGC